MCEKGCKEGKVAFQLLDASLETYSVDNLSGIRRSGTFCDSQRHPVTCRPADGLGNEL